MEANINVYFLGNEIISKKYDLTTPLYEVLLEALEINMSNGEIQIFIPSNFELQLLKGNYDKLDSSYISDKELAQAKKVISIEKEIEELKML